jgi:predicted NBD/HSP70 family sugar kinase
VGASGRRFLIGIGIDENLQWATAYAGETGILAATVECNAVALDDDRGLEEQLVELLDDLDEKHPGALGKADAIGVNTIGIVETKRHSLSNITRKEHWRTRGKSEIFNFRDFFAARDRSKRFNFEGRLLVHNEASGSALAEFAWGIEKGHVPKDTKRLLYLRFDEGVNGGIIDLRVPMEEGASSNHPERGAILPAIRHPEIGHVRPRQHDLDAGFIDAYSGCPSHKNCYEGIASAARIRKQWGGSKAGKDFTLADLPANHPMWVIEANYIAQLCLTAVLMFSPEIVIVGGSIGGNAKLINMVHGEFLSLNKGYFDYPEMRPIEHFIKRGLFGPEVTVFGALQLAERAASGKKGQMAYIAEAHLNNVVPIRSEQ